MLTMHMMHLCTMLVCVHYSSAGMHLKCTCIGLNWNFICYMSYDTKNALHCTEVHSVYNRVYPAPY